MTEERLLGDLCEVEGLPQPLYDLEVTGGDLETVCCMIGRLKVTCNDVGRLAAREGAAKKMRLLITTHSQEKERVRKLSMAPETEGTENREIFVAVKDQFSSLGDLCEKIGLPGPVYDLEQVLSEDVHVCCMVGPVKMTAAHEDRDQAKILATQRVLREINKQISKE